MSEEGSRTFLTQDDGVSWEETNNFGVTRLISPTYGRHLVSHVKLAPEDQMFQFWCVISCVKGLYFRGFQDIARNFNNTR